VSTLEKYLEFIQKELHYCSKREDNERENRERLEEYKKKVTRMLNWTRTEYEFCKLNNTEMPKASWIKSWTNSPEESVMLDYMEFIEYQKLGSTGRKGDEDFSRRYIDKCDKDAHAELDKLRGQMKGMDARMSLKMQKSLSATDATDIIQSLHDRVLALEASVMSSPGTPQMFP
jgi:hypothetical protein